MKKVKFIRLVAAIVFLGCLSSTVNAQTDSAKVEKESIASIDAGLDIYSSYIWRGAKFGTGPAFQPWVEGAIGNLSIGAWGSVNAGDEEAFEMDLYLGYSFDFGLGITISDYYFGGYSAGVDSAGNDIYMSGEYFAYDKSHYLEPSLSYEFKNFSIMGAYMFAPGFEDGDMYFEVGYSKGAFSAAIGAGDGAYTSDGNFMICNIKIGASKEIQITDKYSLPISGSVVLNPSTEGFFIAAGVSF